MSRGKNNPNPEVIQFLGPSGNERAQRCFYYQKGYRLYTKQKLVKVGPLIKISWLCSKASFSAASELVVDRRTSFQKLKVRKTNSRA